MHWNQLSLRNSLTSTFLTNTASFSGKKFTPTKEWSPPSTPKLQRSFKSKTSSKPTTKNPANKPKLRWSIFRKSLSKKRGISNSNSSKMTKSSPINTASTNPYFQTFSLVPPRMSLPNTSYSALLISESGQMQRLSVLKLKISISSSLCSQPKL